MVGSASPQQRKVVIQKKSRVLLLCLPAPEHRQGTSQTDLAAPLGYLPVPSHGPSSILYSALSRVPGKRSGEKAINIHLRLSLLGKPFNHMSGVKSVLYRDAQTHPTCEDFAQERFAARTGKPLEAVAPSALPSSSPALLVSVLGCVPGEQMYYCTVSPPHIVAVSSTDLPMVIF